MSFVSVIIPCFNHARYLGEALESVLSQSRPPDEIIVVDDGSTDGSAAIAARYPVRIFAQPNQGIGGARNKGLSVARGDVIGFLDADDVWTENSLARRLDLLASAPALTCVFGMVEHFISPELDPSTAASLECPQGASAARFAGVMLARKSLFDAIGPFDAQVRVGEMMDLAARLAESGASTANLDAVVMRRRIHGANTVLRERASHGDYLRVLKASLARKAAAQKP